MPSISPEEFAFINQLTRTFRAEYGETDFDVVILCPNRGGNLRYKNIAGISDVGQCEKEECLEWIGCKSLSKYFEKGKPNLSA